MGKVKANQNEKYVRAACPKDKLEFNFLSSGTVVCCKECFKTRGDKSGQVFMQRAKKVVSNSPGLVDFAIGLVNSVFNLPDGQVMFFEEFD